MDSSSPIAGNIKAIDRDSIHRICSGQVVLTLAVAVKELIENSIDAGATNIEVKLKEYGSELIEVYDNGCGIKECDFKSLTLKHHTSKLENFSDLVNVETFGFRGEALSSLCALSKLSVTTCHETCTVGSKLEYDHGGTLVNITPVARQMGTTVCIEHLFSTLPVRHKEFHKNLRKEFGKMVHLLTAYCIISTGIRITCVNNTMKGRKTIVLSTNGNSTIKDNLMCIYGSKQMKNLMSFIQKEPSETILEEFSLKSVSLDETYSITGYISSCIHGEGRSSADRQFFYINGRPCDLPKVSKTINDVYHSFNRHQYPFICVNVEVAKGSADVNVTPDKRQIFVSNEKLLLATIKTSVLALYEHQPSVLKLQNSFCMPEEKNSEIQTKLADDASNFSQYCLNTQGIKRSLNSPSEDFSEANSSLVNKFQKLSDLSEAVIKDSNVNNARTSSECTVDKMEHDGGNGDTIISETGITDDRFACDDELGDCNSFIKTLNVKDETSLDNDKNKASINIINNINFTVTRPFKEEKLLDTVKLKHYDNPQSSILKSLTQFTAKKYSFPNSVRSVKEKTQSPTKRNLRKKIPTMMLQNSDDVDFIIQQHRNDLKKYSLSNNPDGCNKILNMAREDVCAVEEIDTRLQLDSRLEDMHGNEDLIICTDKHHHRKKKTVIFECTLDDIKEKIHSKGIMNERPQNAYRKFRSKINGEEAESELQKEISKDMFSEMQIIGQFNLGFIITKLGDDLFIIDQHATDEKYNFEVLQRDIVLETQKLLNSQVLELTAASEEILIENMTIFEKNGFKFKIMDDGTAGQRVQLVSVPVSQNWSFGKEDVDELIFMLSDNSGRMCRPSRVCQMFASRACRKSVMIGTSLSHQTMKKLVCHMGEIDQPWNCPHGRPTMRHLFNMNLLMD